MAGSSSLGIIIAVLVLGLGIVIAYQCKRIRKLEKTVKKLRIEEKEEEEGKKLTNNKDEEEPPTAT